MALNRKSVDRLKWTRLRAGIALGSILCCHAGCNRGPAIPSTESVSGTVTLKGKPIGGVEVYFVSERMVAFGKTDDQGHYDLVQGAVPGENQVYFSKIEGGGNPGFQMQEGIDEYQLQMAAAAGGKKASLPKQVIPAEYSNASAPKLNFVVPDGGTDSADFKL